VAARGCLGPKRRRKGTTRPGKSRWKAPDLVKRDFPAEQINVKWYGDGTEIPADEGKLYLLVTWNHRGVSLGECRTSGVASPQADGHSRPPPGGGFKTKIDQYCDLVTLNVLYKSSRLKQYLKDGVALRIETVINSPKDLRCNRMLGNLPELQAKARAINDRLLHTEVAGQGTALVSPVIERITRPTVTDDGRKAPALRFGDLRVQALAGATAAMLFTVTGITNRSLRALMSGLLHRPYSMSQASYDLSRLARNGLIARVPSRNRYTLTRDGLLFAHIYVKVYDHVLRPLMAPDRPNAPPEFTAALDTLDQLAASHIAKARVPTAA